MTLKIEMMSHLESQISVQQATFRKKNINDNNSSRTLLTAKIVIIKKISNNEIVVEE